MIWVLFTVVAVLLVGVLAGLLAGRIGYDPLSEPVTSQPDTGLAEDFTARSISEVHFDTALRGYRMDQVDQVLDALQDRLGEQERELARLRGGDTSQGDAAQAASATPGADAVPGTHGAPGDDAAHGQLPQRDELVHREHDA